ncbi:MAG: molybdenum cofactor guanylyltransferase [Bacteroidales bacterium]
MTDREARFTAVVLAGGKNSRFGGRDKAFVSVEGVLMIKHVLDNLKKIFRNILIITNTPEKYTGFTDPAFASDIIQDAGPLGGIHSAMKNSGTPYIFVVSCDMPYLDTGIIKDQLNFFRLLNNPDIMIPRINSGIEPLHGIYRTDLAGELDRFLSVTDNYSIRAFLDEHEVAYFDPGDSPRVRKAFSNINRPDDIPA